MLEVTSGHAPPVTHQWPVQDIFCDWNVMGGCSGRMILLETVPLALGIKVVYGSSPLQGGYSPGP